MHEQARLDDLRIPFQCKNFSLPFILLVVKAASLCCYVDDNERYCKCRDYHHLNFTGRLVAQKVRPRQTVKFHY